MTILRRHFECLSLLWETLNGLLFTRFGLPTFTSLSPDMVKTELESKGQGRCLKGCWRKYPTISLPSFSSFTHNSSKNTVCFPMRSKSTIGWLTRYLKTNDIKHIAYILPRCLNCSASQKLEPFLMQLSRSWQRKKSYFWEDSTLIYR